MVEARELIELQAKLAFAEDLLETLNTTVYRQQERIDRLERELRELRRLVQEAQPPENSGPLDELPPHY